MNLHNLCIVVLAISLKVKADLCPEPHIPNGQLEGEKSTNSYVGDVACDLGYHLVGSSSQIKCRDGQWSVQPLPACAALGSCLDLEQIENGRNVPIQGSRQSAFKFKCRKGFKLYGEKRTYCEGEHWSHSSLPVCTAPGCDAAGVLDIPYGEGRAMLGGRVYRYRCNVGVEMKGHDTIYCDGEYWNGTVPACLVTPGTPQLSISVSGSSSQHYKSGDVLDISCQAVSGNPMPYVAITWPRQQGRGEEWTRLSNSVTVTVTEVDDGEKITCTAQNMAGTAHTSTVLHIISPPTSVQVTGPLNIQQNKDYEYQCAVGGGKPVPEVAWFVKDSLGNSKAVEGDRTEEGVAKLILRTEDADRRMEITCSAENPSGRASHTIAVHMHYLPMSLEIEGPEIGYTGDSVQLQCSSVSSFPAPAVKWRVEKAGEITEVDDVEGDVSTVVMEDGSITATSILKVSLDPGVSYVRAECRAIIEELGETRSSSQKIKVAAALAVPRISGLENFSTLSAGNAVSLACHVGHRERAEYLSWFVDGELQGEDHHLDRENNDLVSRWEYVPGLGEKEAMCQLNGIEKLSGKISFTVQAPVQIVQMENKDIFGDDSELWIPHKNAIDIGHTLEPEYHIVTTESENLKENFKEVEDFEAVKEIFMKIAENVDTIDENIEEEFRRSDHGLKTTAIDLTNFEENYYSESDKDDLIVKSSSYPFSLCIFVIIISSSLLLAL